MSALFTAHYSFPWELFTEIIILVHDCLQALNLPLQHPAKLVFFLFPSYKQGTKTQR